MASGGEIIIRAAVDRRWFTECPRGHPPGGFLSLPRSSGLPVHCVHLVFLATLGLRGEGLPVDILLKSNLRHVGHG
ncbi:MAG: hypothetical protein ACE5HM_03625 [Acidiferrobacterales bacterium]